MTETAGISKFWMVWSPIGRAPTFRHLTKKSAQDEATRLANQNPGNPFIVLAAVDAYQSEIVPAAPVKITRAKVDPSEIATVRARIPSLQHGRRFEMVEPPSKAVPLHAVGGSS